MGVFSKKSLQRLLSEAEETGEGTLKRTLSATSLIAIGIGIIIGAGLFAITGMAAANYAGPGIMISFVIAAVGCGLAGLCYAEFASMIPVAGSAYTYSYATMGEFIAWVIGWDLVLEYSVGAATVAASWSAYLSELLSHFGYTLPPELMHTPFEGGILNLPAVFIVLVMGMILIRGMSTSARVNNLIVLLKISIVIVFVAIGIHYIRPENLHPLIPKNQGVFGEFGWSGVFRAAGVVFFAYIGFDAVSTAAQETKNPKKAMPIGILGSLIICTILYILFAYVLTGVTHYTNFKSGDGVDVLAPVATAIEYMGPIVNGTPHPDYPWLNTAIIIAILLGFSSVIMVDMLGQSRVFYSMSKDGLLPRLFSDIHHKFRTPFKSNMLFMLLISLFAAFVPGRIVGEMVSIGTLFAFILVCLGVLFLRYNQKKTPRSFKVPFVPFTPILGALICLLMMAFLPFDTWIRLLVWLLLGLDIYLNYGLNSSKVNSAEIHKKDKILVSLFGMGTALLLLILALVHHLVIEQQSEENQVFFIVSLVIGGIHLLYFGFRALRGRLSMSD